MDSKEQKCGELVFMVNHKKRLGRVARFLCKRPGCDTCKSIAESDRDVIEFKIPKGEDPEVLFQRIKLRLESQKDKAQ